MPTVTAAPCPSPPAPSETYLIDAATWRLLELNDAARSNVQYDASQLAAMTLLDLAPELAASIR